MKNLFIKTIPFLSILFVACSSDDVTDIETPSSSVNTNQMTFSASMEADDAITRTYINSTDKKTYWSKSDKILVYNTTTDSKGEFSIPNDKYVADSKNAIFTGNALSINEGEGATNNFVALYPADANAKFTSENKVTATLPSRQDISKATSINTDYLFMTGRTTASNFAFKNAVSFVKVKVTSSDNFQISRIKVVANALSYIAGTFTATVKENGSSTISVDESSRSTFVELYNDDFSTIKDGTYYLAVLPSYSNTAGMTLLLEDVKGNKAYQRIKTGFSFEQSKLYNLGSYEATDSEVNGKTVSSVTASLGGGKTAIIENVVDLGLPSGTLWAMNDVTNVAGDNSETSGYYAWGEVNSKDAKKYTWKWDGLLGSSRGATYAYGGGSANDKDNFITISSFDYYNGQAGILGRYNCNDDYKQNKTNWTGTVGAYDNVTVLGTDDDVAYIGSDGVLCMPTKAQADELINSIYTTVSGFTVTSNVPGYKNLSIEFYPGAFKREGTSHFSGTKTGCYKYSYDNNNGYYWTRTLATTKDGSETVTIGNNKNTSTKAADFMAMSMFITSNGITVGMADRCEGRRVRPVVANANAATLKTYSELKTNAAK